MNWLIRLLEKGSWALHDWMTISDRNGDACYVYVPSEQYFRVSRGEEKENKFWLHYTSDIDEWI